LGTKNLTIQDNCAQNQLGLNESEFANLSGQQAQLMQLHKQGYRLKDAALLIGVKPETAYVTASRARIGRTTSGSKVVTSDIDDLIKTMSPEEKAQTHKILATEPEQPDWNAAAFAFNAQMNNKRIDRTHMIALARDGMGDWDAQRALISTRAQAIKILAIGSRIPLLKVNDREVIKLMRDVLTQLFRPLGDNTWQPLQGNAREIYYHQLHSRLIKVKEQIRKLTAAEKEIDAQECLRRTGLLLRFWENTSTTTAIGIRMIKGSVLGSFNAKGRLMARDSDGNITIDIDKPHRYKVQTYAHVIARKTWVTEEPEAVSNGDVCEIIGQTLVVVNYKGLRRNIKLVRANKLPENLLTQVA
jgi:hypothetical protein